MMEAFIEGYCAGVWGIDPRLSPYDKLTREWQDWQRGHGMGVERRKAAQPAETTPADIEPSPDDANLNQGTSHDSP